MLLENSTIVHCAQYAAPYEGNFIKSLIFLENELIKYNCRLVYIFPDNVREQHWWNDFKHKHIAHTTNADVRKSVKELYNIFLKYNPVIVHTHFDGYDISVKKASSRYKKTTRKVICNIWHLHDYITYNNNPIKKLYQHYCFLKHYSSYSKNVSIIGVCDDIKDFVLKYNRLLFNKFNKSKTILNGIDCNRITQYKNWQDTKSITKFLTFGGRNVQKRIDIIFDAFNMIYENTTFKPELYITIGTDTIDVVSMYFNNEIPSWCHLINQNEDITSIFSFADCFISASVHETFSYAICEASIYGIPIIQSDIPGTKWNAINPSVKEFKSLDVAELSNQICSIIETPIDKIKNDCLVTRQNNIKEYSLENWSKKIINFYNCL